MVVETTEDIRKARETLPNGKGMTDCEAVGECGCCGSDCPLFLIGECDAHWLKE